MNFLLRAWSQFIDLLRPRNVYATETIKEFPETLEPKRVYLVGDNSVPWFAALLCPCGCGDLIRLSLLKNDRPRWRVTRHFTGTVTLKPSIWRKKGCRSHFFVRRGGIIWALQSSASCSRNSSNRSGPGNSDSVVR